MTFYQPPTCTTIHLESSSINLWKLKLPVYITRGATKKKTFSQAISSYPSSEALSGLSRAGQQEVTRMQQQGHRREEWQAFAIRWEQPFNILCILCRAIKKEPIRPKRNIAQLQSIFVAYFNALRQLAPASINRRNVYGITFLISLRDVCHKLRLLVDHHLLFMIFPKFFQTRQLPACVKIKSLL